MLNLKIKKGDLQEQKILWDELREFWKAVIRTNNRMELKETKTRPVKARWKD